MSARAAWQSTSPHLQIFSARPFFLLSPVDSAVPFAAPASPCRYGRLSLRGVSSRMLKSRLDFETKDPWLIAHYTDRRWFRAFHNRATYLFAMD